MASIVLGFQGGEQVAGRVGAEDARLLRQARDIAIIQMREGLGPHRRAHSWREIGREVGLTHMGVKYRYQRVLGVYPKVARAIRESRLV